MFRLYKKQKLCSTVAIDTLFSRGADVLSGLSFPLRAVWMVNPNRKSDAPIQFLISVPKKRLRHAVDRVTMRRRIREAFRLNHQNYSLDKGVRVDLAIIYVDSHLQPYAKVEKSVKKLLEHLVASVNEKDHNQSPEAPVSDTQSSDTKPSGQ